MIRIFTLACLFATLGLSNGISQTITTGAVSTPLCAGVSISVPYIVSSQFNGANVFRVELSDSSGNFTSPQIIGVLADSVSNSITATIPSNSAGTHYRIRVVASSPAALGSDNGADITVVGQPHPAITFTTPVNFCIGDSVMLNAGSWNSYLWNTGATTSTITVNSAATYSVTVSTTNGCTGSDGQLVTTYSLPSVSFSGLPSAVCSDGGSFILIGVPTGGHFSGSGVSNSTFNPSTLSGTYSITYTYTDPTHGCSNTASNSVMVNPFTNVVITPSGATSFCQGGSVNLNTGIYSSYLWNTGATISSITATVAGTYMVTATAANGCTGTASAIVNVYSLPLVSFSGLPVSVCSDAGDIALTGNPSGGNFSGSGVTNSNFNPASLSGSYNITYSYTDPTHGCHNTSVNTVVVKPFTDVVITTSGTTSFCQGDNVALMAGVYSSYIWNTGATTSSIIASVAGTYIVTVTAANGCTGTASKTVTVYSLPVVNFSGLPASVCSNAGSIALTGSPSGGNFSGSGVTNSNFNPANLSGNYLITYSYTSPTHGCSNTATHNVLVNPFPTVVITPSGATSFCQGDNVTLNAGVYLSYVWNTSATTSSITVNTAGTYTVTATDANGCTGTASETITIYSLPIVNFSGLPASVCSNAGNISLTGSPAGGHFSGSGINNSNFNPSTLSGNYTIAYTYTEPTHGCSNTATHNVTVNPFTNVAIIPSGATSFCQGDNVTLNAGLYASYLWSTGATTSSINVNTAGTYSVTATSADGCTGSASITTTVYSLPVVSFFGLPASVCADASMITLTGTPGGGHFSGTGVTNNDFNPDNLNGNYTITYTYSEPLHGCTNSASHSITVNPFNDVTITPSSGTAICQGDNITLTIGAYASYHWSNGGTTNSITVNTAGTYSVTATAANGCTGTSSIVITVNPLPVVNFSGLPSTVCSSAGNITLTGSPTGGLFIGNGMSGNIFNPQNLSSGNDTITYFYTNAQGCSNSSVQFTTINSVSPIITSSGPTVLCQGGSVTLSVGSFASYHWSNGASTASITINTVGSSTYTVTVTTNSGCTGSSSQVVTIYAATVVSFSGLPSSVCSNAGNITLTGSPLNGNFSGAGINGNTFNPQNLSGSDTITYTYNNPNGCTYSASNTVVITNVSPTMTVTGTTDFCANHSATLTPGIYSSYLWSNGATTASITVNSTGNYTVTVTGGAGCTGTSSQLINVYPLPVVSFTGLPSSTCSDAGLIALTGNHIGGSFSGTGVVGNHFNPTGLSGTYSVTYTYADSVHGCINTATNSITVNAFTPVVITSNHSTTFCAGDSVILNPGAYANYLWSNSSTTNTITVNASGTFSVTCTAANGCSGTASKTVTVNSLPVVSFSGVGAHICSNIGNIILTGSPLGGNFNGMGVHGDTLNAQNVPSGIITITYTYTDTNGCSNSFAQNVGIANVDPTISANAALQFCSGDSITLTAAASNTSYIWSNGATTQATTIHVTGNYTVTVTGLYGCTSSSTDTITVYTNPAISFTISPSTICSNAASIALTATPVGGVFSGNGITNNNFNPHNLSGAEVITYTYTDSVHGCSSSAQSTITVNAFPTLSITLSGGNSFCQGGTQVMTVGNYASYIWSDGNTTNSISVGNTGRYTVTVTAANGCTGIKSDSITVWPLPIVSFSGLPTGIVCNEWVTYQLTANPSGGNFYGSGISGSVFNPYGQPTQTDIITYYYTDSHGCIGYAHDTVMVKNCTGIPLIQTNNGVGIYPNPNNGNFIIQYDMTQPDAVLNIRDITGRLVSITNIIGTSGNQTINTDLSEGIYFWEVINSKGIDAKGKIVVTK